MLVCLIEVPGASGVIQTMFDAFRNLEELLKLLNFLMSGFLLRVRERGLAFTKDIWEACEVCSSRSQRWPRVHKGIRCYSPHSRIAFA